MSSSTINAPVFQANGLASGMDTSSIVDKLVQIESAPITDLQQQQSDIQTQISSLGDIISKVNALDSATDDLAQNGVFATATTSSNTSFTATPGTSATPGNFNVQVNQLAAAASWRSDGFASTDAVAAGTLQLTVQGLSYPPSSSAPITITQGDSLQDIASKIEQTGAPVSATVLTDSSGKSYLSITALQTGAPLDGSAALSVNFTRASSATGDSLNFGTPTVQAGANAEITVDGLQFVRSSNSISDVLPGVTLSLNSVGQTESLVVATDPNGTATRLQKFVDAYNTVMSAVQAQLNVNQNTDRATSLVGDPAVRDLATRLQTLISTVVPGLSGVRTLADLGLETNEDGSLSLDSNTLSSALSTNPAAVNAVFSTAQTGIGAVMDSLTNSETASGVGFLSARQQQLNQTVSQLSQQEADLQQQVDTYRQNLINEFTAMESTVAQLKSIGSYLSGSSASAFSLPTSNTASSTSSDSSSDDTSSDGLSDTSSDGLSDTSSDGLSDTSSDGLSDTSSDNSSDSTTPDIFSSSSS